MLGHHISKGDGFEESIREAKELYDIKAAQIFVAGPRNYTLANIPSLKHLKKELDIKLYAHSSYLTRPWDQSDKTIEHTNDQLDACKKIGVEALVIHLPKNTLQVVIDALKLIKNDKVDVYLEIPSVTHDPDKSWELPEQINKLCKAIKKQKINGVYVCIDTCHIWAAGTSLQTKEEAKAWINALEYPEYIKMIHLNDSYHPMSYGKDKHAQLFEGYIWKNIKPKESGAYQFIKFAKKYNIPIILERNGLKNENIEKEYKIVKNML
jgi:deoxyribonuclease IV